MDFKVFSMLLTHFVISYLVPGTSLLSRVLEEGDSREAYNVTTNVADMDRRQPPKVVYGRNRFSLLNSRYNRRPRKKNLDPHELADLLGDFYDPNWMSVDAPSGLTDEKQDVTYLVRPDAWPYQELIKALRTTNVTYELGKNLTPAQVAVIERWFLKKASCPVKYAWEDVGPMFWPRWIRRGECVNAPSTCSWPPGMHCVETAKSNLQVLRWQCRAPKNKSRRGMVHKKREWRHKKEPDPSFYQLRCQWIRVPYPITSACRCTC